MKSSPSRIIGITAAALVLGSCSYSYDVVAVVMEGRLAFVVDTSSDHQPECISSITVEADRVKTVAATVATGDRDQLIANGVVWGTSLVSGCQNPFPIFYGQPLKGERMAYGENTLGADDEEASSITEARPLRIGVVYEVSTTSGATGYGGGAFKVLPNRTVVNVPPPPLTDTNDLLEPVVE